MRKPRDYDAELKALDAKANLLKERRTRQLGELIEATGAEALDLDTLAGALLAAVKADKITKEGWQTSGAAFFRGDARQPRRGDRTARKPAATRGGDAQPAASGTLAL